MKNKKNEDKVATVTTAPSSIGKILKKMSWLGCKATSPEAVEILIPWIELSYSYARSVEEEGTLPVIARRRATKQSP